MEKVIQVFPGFEEAESAEREFYAGLTPQERVEIVTRLREHLHPNRVSIDGGKIRPLKIGKFF